MALRDIIYLHDNTPSLVGRNQNLVNFNKVLFISNERRSSNLSSLFMQLRNVYLCAQKWFESKQYDTQGLCSPKICTLGFFVSHLETTHSIFLGICRRSMDVKRSSVRITCISFHFFTSPISQKKYAMTIPSEMIFFSSVNSQVFTHSPELDDTATTKLSLIIPHYDESLINPVNAMKVFRTIDFAARAASPKRSLQGIFKENSKALVDVHTPRQRRSTVRRDDQL